MNIINTAAGQIQSTEMGPTLPHEHLLINLMAERRGDGLLNDSELMIGELRAFTEQGGGAIFDLTTAELTMGTIPTADSAFSGAAPGETRDPGNVAAVAAIAKSAGVNVVLGTGHYRDPFLNREFFDRQDSNRLAEALVRDLTVGFGETGIKAGIIGEIGADKWYISALEERSFRAAARAHRQTNAAVYTHAARWDVGLAQLDLLAEEDVDPARVAIGHVDTVPINGFAVQVAKRGVYVGVDTINSASKEVVQHRVDMVMELVRAGYIDRILLSHDVCLTSQLRSSGGNGFGFILGHFRDALLAAGLDAEEFSHIVTANPARLIEF